MALLLSSVPCDNSLPVNSDLLKLGPTNLDLLGIIQTQTETNLARKSYKFIYALPLLFTNIQVTGK